MHSKGGLFTTIIWRTIHTCWQLKLKLEYIPSKKPSVFGRFQTKRYTSPSGHSYAMKFMQRSLPCNFYHDLFNNIYCDTSLEFCIRVSHGASATLGSVDNLALRTRTLASWEYSIHHLSLITSYGSITLQVGRWDSRPGETWYMAKTKCWPDPMVWNISRRCKIIRISRF